MSDQIDERRRKVKEKVSGRIREARKKRGMSQVTLAERCGVSKSSVLRWEQGTNQTPLHQLIKIADALGRDLAFFLQDLSSRISLAEDLEWLPAEENGDRAEMSVRLKDLVEAVDNVTIYVGADDPPAAVSE